MNFNKVFMSKRCIHVWYDVAHLFALFILLFRFGFKTNVVVVHFFCCCFFTLLFTCNISSRKIAWRNYLLKKNVLIWNIIVSVLCLVKLVDILNRRKVSRVIYCWHISVFRHYQLSACCGAVGVLSFIKCYTNNMFKKWCFKPSYSFLCIVSIVIFDV